MRLKNFRIGRTFNLGNYESRRLSIGVKLDSSHELNEQVIEELERRLIEANLMLEQKKRNLIKETTDKVLAQIGVSASTQNAAKKES